MAEIFLARSHGMAGFARYVVLKRILPERGTDPRWIEMFLDEARLAAQLQHPNVAQVFDLGRLGEGYFFTMEYVHGANMREVLVRCAQRGQRLPLSVALGVASGAASGLDHAHERRDDEGKSLGIVHRDVSPSNLMLSYDGVVKLVDFGVAKAHLRSSVTQSGTVKGKISYLSPEQCRGRDVDRRSDIFALGIVLYEMATTKRLYRRNSDFETMTAIVNEDPEAPSRYNPEVSPQLDALILRALAKDPGQRQQSAAELLEELEEVARVGGHSITNTTLRRQMKELYGEPLEPWRLLEQNNAMGLPPHRETEVTYTADGLIEEDLDSVEVPVPQELVQPRPTAQIRKVGPTQGHEVQSPRPMAPPLTAAFKIDADAAQVPLLDALRAAVAVTADLEHNQSTVRPGTGDPSATEVSPPVRANAAGDKEPQVAIVGPNGSTIMAVPVPESSPVPHPVAESGSRRYAQPATDSSRVQAPRSISDAVTIPVVGKEDADLSRPMGAPTPLPALLASGQVSVGPVGAPSNGPAPSIWDRPMQAPVTTPVTTPGTGLPPAAAAPASPPRSASGTPGYAPKATLLGSAPPPRQRADSRPPPVSGDSQPRLPGMPAHASQPQMPQMPHHGGQPPHLRAPSASQPPNYGAAVPMPAYPRAPQNASGSLSGRIAHQEEEAPRRVFNTTVLLIAVVIIGVGIGAYFLFGGEDRPKPADGAPTTAQEAAPGDATGSPPASPLSAVEAPTNLPATAPPESVADAGVADAAAAPLPSATEETGAEPTAPPLETKQPAAADPKPTAPTAAPVPPTQPTSAKRPRPTNSSSGSSASSSKRPQPEEPAASPPANKCAGPLCRR